MNNINIDLKCDCGNYSSGTSILNSKIYTPKFSYTIDINGTPWIICEQCKVSYKLSGFIHN